MEKCCNYDINILKRRKPSEICLPHKGKPECFKMQMGAGEQLGCRSFLGCRRPLAGYSEKIAQNIINNS